MELQGEAMRHQQLGHAWKDGLEEKYRGARASLPDIPECSSVESVPTYPVEVVESYDLQYIVCDFDFDNLSAFKMRPVIGTDNWDEIGRQRLDLEAVDRRDLIRSGGQDKLMRIAHMLPQQSTSLELVRDDEALPRRRAPVVMPLDSPAAGTPKANST